VWQGEWLVLGRGEVEVGSGTEGGAWDASPAWQARDDVELLTEQLAALSRWHAARRTQTEVVELRGMNRELRLDVERRQMVLARQQKALLARAAVQLAEADRLLRKRAPRAVLVHRREWVRSKVAAELTRQGVHVVAQLEDGADAVGVSIAEQPDVLLVEDALPSMNGAEVLRTVREYCRRTHLAAQVDSETKVAELLEAGAVTAFTRRTPPADIARDLAALVRTS